MEPQNPEEIRREIIFGNENNEVQNSLNMNMDINVGQDMHTYSNPSISDNSKENYTPEDIQREKALQKELDEKNKSSPNNLHPQNNGDIPGRNINMNPFSNQAESNNQNLNNQINNPNMNESMNNQNQNNQFQQNKNEQNDNLNQNQNNINNNMPFSENPMQNSNNIANNNIPIASNVNDINQNNIKNQNDNQNMNIMQQNNMNNNPNNLMENNNQNNPILNQNNNNNKDNNNFGNLNNNNINNVNNANNMNLNDQNNNNMVNNMNNPMNNPMNNDPSNMQLNNQNNNMNNNQLSNMNINQMSNMNNMMNNPMNIMSNNPMGNMGQMSNPNMGIQMSAPNMNKNNDQPYSFHRYTRASKTSLKNLGDTSYLNAVFQLLGTVRNLSSYFVNPNNTAFFENNVKANNALFSYVVHRFFKHLYPYPENTVPEKYMPESLLKILGQLNEVYKSTKRRNPNDLINFSLNQLHRELNSCKTKNISKPNILDKNDVIQKRLGDYSKSNNSIIANNFHWFEIKTRHCNSCNSNFYEFNNFEILELDIFEAYQQFKQPLTLSQCLNFQCKKIQNYFCKKCGSYTQNQVFKNIYSSPLSFIFSLNRGNLDQNLLNINFQVEEYIDISQFIENQKSISKYTLCGIVSISTKENNQYVCFGKSPVDKQWYLYNDENVTDTNINDIIHFNNNHEYIPCILLYQHMK